MPPDQEGAKPDNQQANGKSKGKQKSAQDAAGRHRQPTPPTPAPPKRPKCASIYDNSSLAAKYTYRYLWPLLAKVRKRNLVLRSEDFDNFAPCSCLATSSSAGDGVSAAKSCRAPDSSPLEHDARDQLAREWLVELARQQQQNLRENSDHNKNDNKNKEPHAANTNSSSKNSNRRPSLFRAIARAFWAPCLTLLLLVLLSDCLLEPSYFLASVRLIELIGEFPGGKVSAGGGGGGGVGGVYIHGHENLAQLTNTTTTTTNSTTIEHHQQPTHEWPTAGQLVLRALAFCLCLSSYQLLTHPYQWCAAKLALKVRVDLSQMIYAKALRLDKLRAATELRLNFRQANNLISRDLERLEENLVQLVWVVTAPLQCLVITSIVGQNLDFPTALITMMVNGAVAFQRGYMNVRVRRYTHRASQAADARVNLISETLEAIRLVRMYAWTRPLEASIEAKRREEWRNRRRVLFVNSLDVALFFITCSASAIFSVLFGFYVRDLPVTQSMVTQIFLISTFFRRLLARQLPQGLLSWMNLLVILERLQLYLGAPDQRDHRQLVVANGSTSGGGEAATNNGHHHNELTTAKRAAQTNEGEEQVVARLALKRVAFSWPPAALELKNQQQQKQPNGQKQVTGSEEVAQHGTTTTTTGDNCCFGPLQMEARDGELVLVAGRVGCGKSTLLQVILGELAPSPGGLVRMRAGTKLAYAPQEAWIFSGTVRENILFGQPLRLERYVEVLRACSLAPDLCSFPDFDRTLIGERGVTLSGGQKARINLARALYQQADLYLLDDPLSAVDAHVASHLFRSALRGFLAGKTVILVTHQTQYLAQADKVLYLGSGGGRTGGEWPAQSENNFSFFFGTHAELEKSRLLEELLRGTQAAQQANESADGRAATSFVASDESEARDSATHGRALAARSQADKGEEIARDYIVQRILSSRQDESTGASTAACGGGGNAGTPQAASGHFYARPRDEMFEVARSRANKRDLSSVWRALWFWLRHAGGRFEHVAFFATNVGCRFFFIGINIFMNFWAGSQVWARSARTGQLESHAADLDLLVVGEAADATAADAGSVNQMVALITQLTIYQALGVACLMWLAIVAMASARGFLYFTMCYRAALAIHRRLVASLLWTRMSFFDATPAGHLLNRISADTSYMDTTLLTQLDDLSLTGLSVAFVLISMVASVPKLTLVVLCVMALTCLLFRWLTSLMEAIKYLDGFRRAALYSHVAATLDGLAAIRASGQGHLFEAKFASLLNRHSSVRFLNVSVRRAIIGCLDWILVVFYASLVTLDVYDTLRGWGMYAFVGINLCCQMTRLCQNTFSQFVHFYLSVQSLDRVREYSEQLEHEQHELLGPYLCAGGGGLAVEDRACAQDATTKTTNTTKLQDHLSAANFPRGAIQFAGVSLKYAHTSNKVVLRNLTFEIPAGAKVGVVGRTGAGKSSLITVLFHLYHFEGFVYIDGQDTKELQLESLRSSLSIIPQDPALFSGSLRDNLDPFGEHADAALWRALGVVQLRELVQRNPQGLAMLVSESGGNFSVGQRQLICLARAILKQNRVLVLDEATANIDQETDALIQRAIRSEFAHCTVLTIAHRLNTIVDSDRLMIMDAGEVREFGTPRELLARGPTGMLARLVDSTGAQQAALLRAKILATS